MTLLKIKTIVVENFGQAHLIFPLKSVPVSYRVGDSTKRLVFVKSCFRAVKLSSGNITDNGTSSAHQTYKQKFKVVIFMYISSQQRAYF